MGGGTLILGIPLSSKLECDAYNLDADIPTLFSAKVMDRVIQVDTLDYFIYRSMQIRVHAEALPPMSQEVEGWETAEVAQWFSRNPIESKQRASSVVEAEENQILIQTMTHIMYDELPFGQKEYKFKFDDLVALGE